MSSGISGAYKKVMYRVLNFAIAGSTPGIINMVVIVSLRTDST
jgi:hypothetical protein